MVPRSAAAVGPLALGVGEIVAGPVTGGVAALVYGGTDPLVARAIERAAAEHGATLMTSVDAVVGEQLVVVVDMDPDDGFAQVSIWRSRCPSAVVVGVTGQPDADRWRAAERAGCDKVTSRGAVGPQLRRWLVTGALRRRRMALLDSADIAGRLGLVQRVDDTPLGPLAVFRADGALYAMEDRCPHAASRLSDGTLQGTVLTCPGHGSQFDVCSGDRLRGPADTGVATHRLLEEDGRVYLEWSQPGL